MAAEFVTLSEAELRDQEASLARKARELGLERERLEAERGRRVVVRELAGAIRALEDLRALCETEPKDEGLRRWFAAQAEQGTGRGGYETDTQKLVKAVALYSRGPRETLVGGR